MMQCPSCGYQNRPDVRFCISCGVPVSQDNQPANMPPPQNPAGAQTTGQGWQQPPIILPPHPTPMQEQSVRPISPVQSGRRGDTSIGRKVLFAIIGILVAIILAVTAYGLVSHQTSSNTPHPIVAPTIVPPTTVPPTIVAPTIVPPTIPPTVAPPFVPPTL